MMNRKAHVLVESFLFFLIFPFVCTVAAQPTCSSSFHAFDTCHWAIQNKDVVFFARVLSIEEKTRGQYGSPSKIIVEVEKPLKGKTEQQVELFLDTKCFGGVAKGYRYIFTAQYVNNERVSGLFSEKWSTMIGPEYSDAEVDKILDEIKSVIAKIRQPRLIGRVIQKNWSPDGRYLMRASSINTKLGYDPNYAHPLVDVIVTARRIDDLREFKTKTNGDGRYIFNGLPNGIYEVSTDLPVTFDIDALGVSHYEKTEKIFVEIDDQLCSKKIDFNAQPQGAVKLHADNALKRWTSIIVSLWRVEVKDGKKEFFETFYDVPKNKIISPYGSKYSFDHFFENVPAGRYILVFSFTDDPQKETKYIFYPGVLEKEKAEILTIEAGETYDLALTFPD